MGDTGDHEVKGSDIVKAFALVIAAGACTGLGGLSVLWGNLSRRFLGGALGLAAGVMLYIALVDIYAQVAVEHFVAAGCPHNQAFTYATLCLVAGFPCVAGIDKLSEWILETAEQRAYARKGINASAPDTPLSQQNLLEGGASHESARSGACSTPGPSHQAPQAVAADVDACKPARLDHQSMNVMAAAEDVLTPQANSTIRDTAPTASFCDLEAPPTTQDGIKHADAISDPEGAALRAVLLAGHESRLLLHTSILTGVALAIHNLPEGIVTFTGYMSSPSTGYAIVLAVALHNIPEGMVVAMPVMYATGSRARAIFWAFVSGAVEPLGGLIGLGVVLGGGMQDEAMGVIMGMVAGIMVFISVRELIPKALQFDPEDKVVTWSVLVGMLIMAASLVMLGFLS